MAVTLAVAVNGAVLLMFNSAAEESQENANHAPTVVTLDLVRVAAHRS